MLVALEISSIMVLMIGNYANTTFRMFSHFDKVVAAGDSFEEVKMFIAPNFQCTSNLKDTALAFGMSQGVPIPHIKAFNPDGTSTTTILSSGQKMNGMEVESMRLVPYTKVDPALIMANLEIKFKKNENSSAGPSELKRKLPIFARVKSGKITECWGKKDHGAAELNQICLTSSQGRLDTFDPITKTCKLANGEWFAGDLNEASCPNGTIMPANFSPEANCRGSGGAGFMDTFPDTYLQMTDGRQSGRKKRFVHVRRKNNSCSCDWAADVPNHQLNNAKCEILCIVQ